MWLPHLLQDVWISMDRFEQLTIRAMFWGTMEFHGIGILPELNYHGIPLKFSADLHLVILSCRALNYDFHEESPQCDQWLSLRRNSDAQLIEVERRMITHQ